MKDGSSNSKQWCANITLAQARTVTTELPVPASQLVADTLDTAVELLELMLGGKCPADFTPPDLETEMGKMMELLGGMDGKYEVSGLQLLGGLTLQEAEQILATQEIWVNGIALCWITIVSNCTAGVRVLAVRAVKVDGEEMMVTMDYRTDRVNVEIRDSVIIEIDSIW